MLLSITLCSVSKAKGRRGERGRRGEGEKGRRGEGEKGRRGEGVEGVEGRGSYLLFCCRVILIITSMRLCYLRQRRRRRMQPRRTLDSL